jgi:hypothetical protein
MVLKTNVFYIVAKVLFYKGLSKLKNEDYNFEDVLCYNL